MAVKIQIRRDTAANWTANNPTMSQGEIAYEVDTEKFKIGNGTDPWTTLNYVGVDGASAYGVAVENGFVGDEATWLNSLIGPPNNFSDLLDKDIEDFEQTVSTMGTVSADAALANVAGKVVNITMGGNFAITGHDLTTGQSTNLIITQDTTGGRVLTWPAGTKFAGANADLSADPDAVDIVGVFYDGTTLYVSISAGYATV